MTSRESAPVRRVILTTLTVVALAACEEDEPEPAPVSNTCYQTTLQNCGSGPWDPFGIALAFAWYLGGCTEEIMCTNQPVQSSLATGIITDQYIRENWTTARANEIEPNDTSNTASPSIIQDGGGLRLIGSVNRATDNTDIVAVAMQSCDLHAIYLCSAIGQCTLPFLQTNALYLELLDQNEVVMQTTEHQKTVNGHEIAFSPSYGVMYYVAVRAADSGGTDFSYELVITD